MKAELQSLLRRRFPSLWQWYAYRRYLTASYGEPEIRFLSQVVDSARHAIDVGVFEGIYSRRLTRLCRGVIGFEANPASAAFCQAALGKSAVIHNCALSDRAGVVALRLPELAVGGAASAALGTVEPSNDLGGQVARSVEVPAARLDDFLLPPIGFIKIDVEGHEEAVLRGARETIARDRPALLIEIEERHNPGALQRLFAHFGDEGFRVACLIDGRLTEPPSLDTLASRRVGDPDYINNFFFLPAERS